MIDAAPARADGADPRAFLQERLAFLGRAYGSLAIGFYLAGSLVAARLPQHRWSSLVTDRSSQLVLAASAVYFIQWALCRGQPRSAPLLRVIDATTACLSALFSSLMVFGEFPGEVPGLAYGRALLVFTFGLAVRAVIVPSSARRTLLLGVVASAFPVAASHAWYRSYGPVGVPAVLQAVWTALWCLGAVAIAGLASHVIFGLRQEVRKAWQLGQYTLLEKIGEGAMGVVYRASHAMLRRPTAIKLLPPERAGRDRLRRFEQEVQLTSRLTHPNTVAVFDYGRTADGVLYYAMEYLEGLNLEDLVRLDGPQPPGRVCHVLEHVASSLAEAHDVGLIHRDIKPANIILVAERAGSADVVKVVDFGLVKDLDPSVDAAHDNRIAGTPLYLSPEAIASPDRVDPRSDLYSVACVGYYLLTARPVFEGRNVREICAHHLHTAPVLPQARLGAAVPPLLSDLLMRCLDKEPERRPPSARAFLAALRACTDVTDWTADDARLWWSTAGSECLARRRDELAQDTLGRDVVGESAAGTMSFVRPVA